MKLSGYSGRPFLEVDPIIWLCGLHATQASDQSVLVLAAMRYRDTLEFYDAVDGSPIRSVDIGSRETNSGKLRTLLFQHGEQRLLLGGFEYQPVRLWQVPDGEVVAQWKAPATWKAAAVQNRGQVTVAALAVEGTVRQLDAFTGREVGERLHARERRSLLRRNTSELWCVASVGGQVLAGSSDGDVWQWDAGSGDLVAVWRGAHDGPIVAMTAYKLADRVVLVTTGADQAVRVWDVDTGSRIAPEVWISFDLPQMAVAAGGRLLIGGDHEIKQVDMVTGERGPVLAKWEHPGAERTEFDPEIEGLCMGDLSGIEVVFVASSSALWRLDARTGTAV
jgi:hypothetical protein